MAVGGETGRQPMSPEVEKRVDILIVVTGLIVGTLLAAVLALIEAFYSPLRIGGVRVPVSLIMALVTNPLLVWFVISTTRRRLAALLPAAVWCVVWFVAAGRTSEGDLVITQNNWVGLVTLFTGPLAFAVGIYISTLRQRVGTEQNGPAEGPPAASRPTGA
ncbi:MAG TPA: hypothetical protein VL738_30000 [Dactylosporangium sp.]|nr:hypothetical protein [Dactylosporangium sp.]